ncbi:ATP-binding cassette domain-containing protein, partial [Laribacter hongkongensis]
MPLLTLEKASLAFGHHPLLDQVDFALEPGERVGLIGRNGAGKSSLLKVIAGQSRLDDGRLNRQNDVVVAYVPQEPVFADGDTVYDAVAEGLGDIKALLSDYHRVSHELAHASGDTGDLLARMEALQVELEARNGWQFETRIASTLSHLSLDPDTLVSALSGGWKKRV